MQKDGQAQSNVGVNKRLLGDDFLNDLKLPQVDKPGSGQGSLNLNINPYRNKKADELSRKLSEFDNRSNGVNSVHRNNQYRGLNEHSRYQSKNYDKSDRGDLASKHSIEHSNSVSGIEMRNNARYRVETNNKLHG